MMVSDEAAYRAIEVVAARGPHTEAEMRRAGASEASPGDMHRAAVALVRRGWLTFELGADGIHRYGRARRVAT